MRDAARTRCVYQIEVINVHIVPKTPHLDSIRRIADIEPGKFCRTHIVRALLQALGAMDIACDTVLHQAFNLRIVCHTDPFLGHTAEPLRCRWGTTRPVCYRLTPHARATSPPFMSSMSLWVSASPHSPWTIRNGSMSGSTSVSSFVTSARKYSVPSSFVRTPSLSSRWAR